MKMTVERKVETKEPVEIEVEFPYYYEADFAPDPHTHPTYYRLAADGTLIKVSEPGCCGGKEHELSVETVDVAKHLEYVTRPYERDYSKCGPEAFERIRREIVEKAAA